MGILSGRRAPGGCIAGKEVFPFFYKFKFSLLLYIYIICVGVSVCVGVWSLSLK
jgi:hypothetical protein